MTTRTRTLLRLAVAGTLAASAALAGQNEKRVSRLSLPERQTLETMRALSPQSLEEIARETSPERLRQRTREILALDSLAIGVRQVDGDGRAAIHRYLLEQIGLRSTNGVSYIGSLKDRIAVPVSLNRLLDPSRREAAASVTIGDRSWSLFPLWPNGPHPSLCPEAGIEGPLVYVDAGEWSDVEGLDLSGAIALMRFQGGRNWERLFMLGAQAVIVAEDNRMDRYSAEGLFSSTPVPFPRFYVDQATGDALRERAARKDVSSATATAVLPGQRATLRGGQLYENRPTESIFAYLPPTAPVVYEIRQADLLERIALENGVTPETLIRENRLSSPVLKTGDRIDIPGRVDPYTVPPRDLLLRLSQGYGVSPESLLKANGLTTPDLRPGLKLTIPNLNDSIVLIARVDSVSVVPDAPHGAMVAENLAAILTVMDHLATSGNIVRRQGVLFAFLDGDNHGGRASRAFAEQILQDRGDLKPAVAKAVDAGTGRFRFLAMLLLSLLSIAVGLLARRTILHRQQSRSGPARRPWLPNAVALVILVAGLSAGALMPLGSAKKGPASAATTTTESIDIAFYESALRWFDHPGQETLSSDTLRWLTTKWLSSRIEKARVSLAEARIAGINRINAIPPPADDEAARIRKEVSALESELALLVELRDRSLLLRSRSPAANLEAFRNRLSEPETARRLSRHKLALPDLLRQLRAETEELAQNQSRTLNNRKVVKKVVGMLHPNPPDDPKLATIVPSVPGWLFWLTDDSQTVSAGTLGVNMKDRFFNVAACSAVTAGWPEEWTYFDGEFNSEFAVLKQESPPIFAEFLSVGKIMGSLLSTHNDRRPRLDTPRDTLENSHLDAVSIQVRTVLTLLKAGLENPAYSPVPSAGGAPMQFSRVVGDIKQFNIRSGIDAQDPVPDAVLYYPPGSPTALAPNPSALCGTRPGIVVFGQLNGSYALPVESKTTLGNTPPTSSIGMVHAFRFNRKQALFDMVGDQASIGTQLQNPKFVLQSGADVEKRIVLTPVYPLVLFADANEVKIVDAVLNGPPRHYAVNIPSTHYGETDISSVLLYAPIDRNVRVYLSANNSLQAILSGRFAGPGDEKGAGYRVGPMAGGDRNLALAMTPLHMAEDLHQSAVRRSQLYHKYGIRDRSLQKAIDRSGEKLATARELMARRQWQASIGAARECWGILLGKFPAVMNLGREAVFSVVFLMALLVPAAVFLERLLIGSKRIVTQLAGATAIFIVGACFLSAFHPAFEIAVSPFIVMIAFTMILMSAMVLSLMYQRFEVLVRRARIAGGEVESEEIGFSSSLATAFSLGVSNLKKRPSRAVLTTFTVSVLTFSIITFVSVTGQDRMYQSELPLDPDVEGVTVKPETPKYEGILLRDFNWRYLSTSLISAMRTEYGTRFPVVARGCYVETTGGNNADREGANQIEILYGGKSAIVNGVMTFEPGETNFSRLNDAVSHGQWFAAPDPARDIPGHRQHIILPADIAESLGIQETALFGANGRLKPDSELPQVRMMNLPWRVIGILDPGKADCIRDINGKSLAMVDYLRSGISHTVSGNLENESATYHVSWRRLVAVPLAAGKDINAGFSSITVQVRPQDDKALFLSDLSIRQTTAVFSNLSGKPGLLTARVSRSIGGLAKIVVPILLCILIVANTMMGTVDERKGEVQMLGAVGLSPSQISLLLLSEATVFSVLGIVFGLFSGLAFARMLLLHPTLLGGLSVNFTSLASTALAMSTGIIVLVATLIPAKRAAALAAPSGMEKWVLPAPMSGGRIDFHLPFTLTRGNAVGMLAFFRQFLLNHTDATSSDFNCRNIAAAIRGGPDTALVLSGQIWLAPYDLDVAQRLSLEVLPTENEGVFRVRIGLARTSGTEESWLRTNYQFIDLVRRQFLLWRNLDPKLRRGYIEKGADLLRGAAAQNPAGAPAPDAVPNPRT